MGVYHPGVFGPFSGKVGSVVAANLNGINVVRNLGRKSSKAASTKQVQQTGMFGFAGGFLSPLIDILNIGYGTSQGVTSAWNRALKYNLAKAVMGVSPDYELIYPKVRLSVYKNLPETLKPTAVAGEEQTINLTWQLDPRLSSTPTATDVLYAVFYNPEQHRSILIAGGIVRADVSATVYVPQTFVGAKVHSWIFFTSADGTKVSDTAYLGEVTILA